MLDLTLVNAVFKTLISNPLLAPCPLCGELAARHDVRIRRFWVADLCLPTILEVHGGCYLCSCCPPGKRWFCLLPPDCWTPGQYTRSTRRLVVDLVTTRKMSAEAAAAFAREDLHLSKLDASTVIDWVREDAEAGSAQSHLEEALSVFSGQMALDELYDGGLCQLVATDPVTNRQLDFALLDHPAKEVDVLAFCLRLKVAGFMPVLVVTDGSGLYPPVIAAVWPEAEHQRCVFHFIKQLNEEAGHAFWEAYRTMPAPPKRKRGRPKKRGRPREDRRKKRDRETVRDARYLIVAREENLDEEQQEKLAAALVLCPPLRDLRRFVLAVHELFGPTTTTAALAKARRAAILDDQDFKTTDGLAKCLALLADDDLFARLTRYLDFENAQRTSNHVERENREYRKRQKGSYRFRSLRSIRALASLLRDRPRPARAFQRVRLRPPVSEVKEVTATA